MNFANDKKEIGFALKVHTALGVDAANKKLDGQDEHLKNIEGKIEALFRKLDTPREREVQKFIDDKGGAKACVDNEATLQELVLKSGESLADMDPTHSGNGDLVSAKKMLNRELAEDVDDAFKKNMKLFDRKMEMQSKQMADAISLTGEHIINVLSGGAHEKIVDAVRTLPSFTQPLLIGMLLGLTSNLEGAGLEGQRQSAALRPRSKRLLHGEIHCLRYGRRYRGEQRWLRPAFTPHVPDLACGSGPGLACGCEARGRPLGARVHQHRAPAAHP